MTEPVSVVLSEPDPDNPGWVTYVAGPPSNYNRSVMGKCILRTEGASTVRMRMFLGEHLLNSSGTVHGGALMGMADVALFSTVFLGLGIDPSYAVTIDLQCQFLAGAQPAESIDSVTEVLRETKRMVFMRGVIVQDDLRVAAFSGIIRK